MEPALKADVGAEVAGWSLCRMGKTGPRDDDGGVARWCWPISKLEVGVGPGGSLTARPAGGGGEIFDAFSFPET